MRGVEIATKPPTASVRVPSTDGGGTRGRGPLEFLQALQDRLHLPYLVQRNFDVIYGTSSGAIIVAVFFALKWDIQECTQHFEMFAQGPRDAQHDGLWSWGNAPNSELLSRPSATHEPASSRSTTAYGQRFISPVRKN